MKSERKAQSGLAVRCSAWLGGNVIEVAERHQVRPEALSAWHGLRRNSAQSPRRANPIPLSLDQQETLLRLRRASQELSSHEKRAASHSTRQRKGLKSSCDVMPPNAALSEAAGKETSK